MNIFFDEYGNTGESTVETEERKKLFQQPYFVLAAIGFHDVKAQNEAISHMARLKKKYKIQSEEIKSKNIYEKKIDFAAEMIKKLKDLGFVPFIEITDKEYYLTIQIIEHLIAPRYSMPNTDEVLSNKIKLANALYGKIPIPVLEKFGQACQKRTIDSYREFLNTSKDNFVDKKIKQNIELTIEDFEDEIEIKEFEQIDEIFLPETDKNARNTVVSLLNHVHSFNNILGRVNLYNNIFANKNKISLIHDEQKLYSTTLFDNLNDLRNKEGLPEIENTFLKNKLDFKLDADYSLIFEDSKKIEPLQIADLVAGVIGRIWSDFNRGDMSKLKRIKPEFIDSFINFEQKVSQVVGINFVVPHSKHQEFFNKIQDL